MARKINLFSIVYVGNPDEARAMVGAGADAVIAHVGTTVGGSIGVVDAACSMDEAVERTQAIVSHTDAVGFVGASSLERMAMESALVSLTQLCKAIPLN